MPAATTSGIGKAAPAAANRYASTADDQAGQRGACIPDRGPRASVTRRGFCPDLVGGPHPCRLCETPLLTLQILSTLVCTVSCKTLMCQYTGAQLIMIGSHPTGVPARGNRQLHRGLYLPLLFDPSRRRICLLNSLRPLEGDYTRNDDARHGLARCMANCLRMGF